MIRSLLVSLGFATWLAAAPASADDAFTIRGEVVF